MTVPPGWQAPRFEPWAGTMCQMAQQVWWCSANGAPHTTTHQTADGLGRWVDTAAEKRNGMTTKPIPVSVLRGALDELEPQLHRPELHATATLVAAAILKELEGAEDLFPGLYKRAAGMRRALLEVAGA